MTHITVYLLFISALLSGCTTAVAIVDVTTATAIYAGKTVVNTIDAITPDIVND
jgi:uncharacterized protein YceK